MKCTPEARLARRLMDTDGALIPSLADEAEDWFAGLAVEWGWNSRYWEQRALAAMKARSYAPCATSQNRQLGIPCHPLPMTTCALANLASVEHDVNLTRGRCEALFQEGIDLLDEAIRMGVRRAFINMHPYHILLSHSVRVARKLTGRIPDKLRRMLELHAAEAERLFGRDPEIGTALNVLRRLGITWRS